MSPSVSVVITTHNRAALLPNALHSVLAQTVQAREIIIIDDGSTDQTRQVVAAQFPQLNYHYQRNQGISKARNIGIQYAVSEWIAFLDDDDEWLPEKLAQQLGLATQCPQARLIHTNEIWIRNQDIIPQRHKHKKYGGMIFRHCLPLCCISPSSVMIHRSVFEHIGLFDEGLPACEDYDMWLRICAVYPVYLIDRVLIKKYGGHADQLSKRYWGMDRFRIRALEKILTHDHQLDPLDRQAVIDMMLKRIAIYLAGAKRHGNTRHVSYFESLRDRYAP